MLDSRSDDPLDTSIAGLFQQLADDGRAYARAELAVVREIARYRAGRAKGGAIALVAGIVIALAGFGAFLVGLVMAIATLVGPLAAAFAVLVGTAVVGGLLMRFGIAKLSALSGDRAEKAALAVGETRP